MSGYEQIADDEENANRIEEQVMEIENDDEGEGAGKRTSVSKKGPVAGLFFAHFLGTFGDRMWQFAIPYLFSKLWKESMEPIAVFCLLLYASTFGGMFYLGQWMDRNDRIKVIRTTIVLEAWAVLSSVLFFWLLLEVGAHDIDGKNQDIEFNWQTCLSYAGLLTTAVLAEVMARGGTIAMEKDWVVVIAEGDTMYQAHLNSWMRRIDLICKLGGPFIFVLLDTILCKQLGGEENHVQFKYGVGVVAAWNVLSVPLELRAVQAIYDSYPKLEEKKQKKEEVAGSINPFTVIYCGAKEYWNHPVRWASVAYCQLWFTVLDNGSLMTAYLVWANVNDFVNVASRGVGALFGIVGTFAFPYILAKSPSLERAGTYSISAFLVIIGVVGVSVGTCSVLTSAYIMVGGVVISRAPLWSFDLAIQQIMQERVEEESRGVVNGVHGALCQLEMVCLLFLEEFKKKKKKMQMCVYIVALIFAHSYDQYYILALISIASVGLATFLFLYWEKRVI